MNQPALSPRTSRTDLQTKPALLPGASESLDDLLQLGGDKFVRSAYRTLLLRDPDPGGLVNYLVRLETGGSKLAVVVELAASDEGKARGVKLPGLDLDSACRENGQAAPSMAAKQGEFGSLLQREGAAFVHQAYRLLLGRDVDQGGLKHYVPRAMTAEGKLFVLRQIIKSPEYATQGVHVPGLQEWLANQERSSTLLARLTRVFRAAPSAASAVPTGTIDTVSPASEMVVAVPKRGGNHPGTRGADEAGHRCEGFERAEPDGKRFAARPATQCATALTTLTPIAQRKKA